MGDPLLRGHIDWGDVALVGLKVVVAFVLLLVATMFMVWFERKHISDMQNRIGPNVAGPFGLLQTLADGIKFFFKEDLKPQASDPLVFRLAPYLSAVTAFLAFTIVPIGGVFENGDPNSGTVTLFGKETYLQVADPPIGILLLLAMSSIAVYGVMLAGWSSGSKYPLIGSVRASAQAISYEAALGMAVVAVVLLAGSLSTHDIVAAQSEGLRSWYWLASGIIPFVVFLIAATAELNRPPFDLVEAEQEIVGGFHTEYSSIRFALFFLAEFMNVITMSAVMITLFFGGPAGPWYPGFIPAAMVTLFFGGPSGPIFFGLDWLWPTFWFLVKVLAFLFVFVWFRATLPRLRYDQLMHLGWKVLIPLMLGWLLVRSAILLWQDDQLSGVALVVGGLVIGVISMGLLSAAFAAGDRAWVRDQESSQEIGR